VSQQPPRITLEPAAQSDFEALVAIRIEAVRESLERIGRFDRVRARERFRSGFSLEHTKHIAAGAERVGFVVTRPHEQYLLLDHLYVRPAHQGRGIGARVLQHVFAQAESLRVPVEVGALRGSDSNRFYTRHGFLLVEQRELENDHLHQAQIARATNCALTLRSSGRPTA
jgi:GNAT superfamily N-acetyltransferase